jgi:DNA-binding transcriptional LysR family regulator
MKVTFHQLQVFECVARRLSFTRAAEELSLSQPTVSAQVKSLADEVGLALFDHAGKSISLTEAGRELLIAARAVFETWSRFEMSIADMRGMKRGALRLACVTTAKYFVPALLGSFGELYPDIELRLEIANRETLLARLKAGEDDLYIMVLPPDDVDVERTPFRRNALVVVAPARHTLAGRRAIPLERLRDEPFILREPGSGTRLRSGAWLAARGFRPRVRMELGSNEAIKHAVAAGLGLAVLSRNVLDLDPAVDGLAVLDVTGFPLDDDWYICHPRGRGLSVAARAFHDHVCAVSRIEQQAQEGLPRPGRARRAGVSGAGNPRAKHLS